MVFITLPWHPYLKSKCPQTLQSGSYLTIKITGKVTTSTLEEASKMLVKC